jgi:exodeoxyribonuclease VII large subunit
MTHRRLQSVTQRLQGVTNQIIIGRQTRLNQASVRLGALSPLAVLSRGYALVYGGDGTLLRSAANTAVGRTIRARLADGTLEAEVTATQIEETDITEKRNS